MSRSDIRADRRNFLRGAAGGALATGAFVGGTTTLLSSPLAAQTSASQVVPEMRLLAHPTITGEPSSAAYWQQVRDAFPLPQNYIHMNTGTTGSQPTFGQNNLAVYNHYKSTDPLHWRQNLAADFPDLFPVEGDSNSIEPRQAEIAAMYGANDDEIVLSYNTSDALLLVFSGTPWQPGDRVVTTNLEHSAMLNPLRWARDYHGVDVSVVQLPANFGSEITLDEVLALFEPALSAPLGNGNKQYLAISEITYKNGLRLPVKPLVELARANGAYSIIDSAHSWGMIPVNAHDYGADFIAGAGHKWLCGGPGTGILYVRNQGDDLPPFAGSIRNYNKEYLENRAWSPAEQMQSRGEYNRPALYAMSDSARFFDHVGLQNIYDRGVHLSNYLKDKVVEKWGPNALWVQKNYEPEFQTFLTSFNPLATKDDPAEFDAMDAALDEVLAKLNEGDPKIYIRTAGWLDAPTIDPGSDHIGFRVSTHPMYNNEGQIDLMFDRLVAAMDELGMPQLGS